MTKVMIAIAIAAVFSVVMLWIGVKNAHIESDSPVPKFEPKPEAPKKKHYRKNYKKKPIDDTKKPIKRTKKSE